MLREGKVVETQQLQRQRAKSAIRSYVSHVIKRCFFKFSLTLLILLSGILVWQKCTNPLYFAVKHIKIAGDLTRVKREDLEQIILLFTKRGFLRLDSYGLKDRLLQQPWIAGVAIQRFWPDTLAVNFTTKVPVASVGDNALLDREGNVFSAGNVQVKSLNLPYLVAPLMDKKYLLQRYQAMQSVVSMIRLNIALLKLVDQQYWFVRLNNGLALYLNCAEAIVQLKRLVAVYSDVIQSKTYSIDYIDLRYAHGMAIKFKKRVA